MPSGLPFDDIRALLGSLPALDSAAVAAIAARDVRLTKPPGSLGRLETLVSWMGAVQGKERPSMDRPVVTVFAGNHGVVAQGVSPYPASVTAAMVANFGGGGAAINQICATYGLGLKVFELALEIPTGDITEGPALDEAACAATMAYGMEAVANGTDLLCLGEMGIGNTTVAAALYHALYGGDAADWVGRGTGVDDAGLARKVDAVRRAVALHGSYRTDPLELLRRLGGREVAAMAGAIVAARIERVPVILDGYVVCAAAAVLHALDPRLLDHCVAGHRSAEGAHAAVLQRLGKVPLLDLGLRLGEGTGAALAAGLLKAALATFDGMATFDEAGVADKAG
ncbi:nicotinate-nucleotide--dimethylbenzimidazole phosphoribosyltransferase [Lichenihabitans sp. Uapishka_5]|nr:nicotinate-nucleotide--dimethylbenzimidazole phosphoribosyltransferase [Lichenihabitans sp. Uapishka_5]MDX7952309.1 nicotinate-nucleotide--dimethylbenzimidazole phosphoribosyltransferase [Lichenihabitans sp. Uapishka_5]